MRHYREELASTPHARDSRRTACRSPTRGGGLHRRASRPDTFQQNSLGGNLVKSNAMRWVLLIFGVLLIVMGIVLFATPAANSIVLAYAMSALMFVYGIAEIIFFICRHDRGASGWMLADGIITTILGGLLLFTDGVKIPTMTLLFSMWVLFTGVTRTTASFAAKDLGSPNWGWVLAAGIIGILAGTWLMFDPLLAFISIGYLLPAVFVVQGVSAVAAFFSTSDDDWSSANHRRGTP